MAPRATTPSNKRKRGAADQGAARSGPAARNNAAAASDSNAQFDDSGLRDIMAHTQTSADIPVTSGTVDAAGAALSDASLTQYQVPPSFDPQSQSGDLPANPFLDGSSGLGFSTTKDTTSASAGAPHTPTSPDDANNTANISSGGGNNNSSGNPKPPVGSDEWHRIRRDNHKEVERRRRETINEGITEISKIVPGCDKNKGSILQRAIQYIGQLKENEQQNIEKWTLEKLLLDQAITELSATAERLKNDAKYYQRERDVYKRACEENEIEPADLKELEADAAKVSEE